MNEIREQIKRLRNPDDYAAAMLPTATVVADTMEKLLAENSELRDTIKMWGKKFEEWNDKAIDAANQSQPDA